MKRLFYSVLIVLSMLVIVGCAQKAVTQAPEQPKQVAPAKTPETVTEQKAAPAQQAAAAPAEQELGIKVEDIHFDFDKSDIRDDAKAVLKNLAQILSTNPKANVTIEGNCDDRGTSEYNLALGDRRANSAKSYLVSLGVSSNRVKTLSYGKEKPLCTESTEACWTTNRRDHFVLTAGK